MLWVLSIDKFPNDLFLLSSYIFVFTEPKLWLFILKKELYVLPHCYYPI